MMSSDSLQFFESLTNIWKAKYILFDGSPREQDIFLDAYDSEKNIRTISLKNKEDINKNVRQSLIDLVSNENNQFDCFMGRFIFLSALKSKKDDIWEFDHFLELKYCSPIPDPIFNKFTYGKLLNCYVINNKFNEIEELVGNDILSTYILMPFASDFIQGAELENFHDTGIHCLCVKNLHLNGKGPWLYFGPNGIKYTSHKKLKELVKNEFDHVLSLNQLSFDDLIKVIEIAGDKKNVKFNVKLFPIETKLIKF